MEVVVQPLQEGSEGGGTGVEGCAGGEVEGYGYRRGGS